jgi:UDP-N-acetylglucosamine--N-acetylmuramyl-(pentapeptide) pyrophosphoryl-undecaprenol N-acetylglucosamine transferase
MKVFIVAGGTGGHLFPAIRLAEEISSRKAADVLFVTSSRKQDTDFLKEKNLEFRTLPVIGMKSGGIKRTFIFLLMLFTGTLKSAYLLARFRPACVIGFGGYVSGPILLLASLSGIRTVIHEQNVYPGRANRMLARFVDRIALNFNESTQYLKGFESKIVISGNLLRKGLKKTQRAGDVFTILAMGGSQGAHILNTMVPRALGLLGPDRKSKLGVVHITGYKDTEDVKKAYENSRVSGRILEFTHDMDKIYAESDFVISRAGATTVSELMYLAKPSILIPYPYAKGHQRLNAMVLERAGLGVSIEEKNLTAEVLKDNIIRMMDRRTLIEMSAKIADVKKEDACGILMKEVLGG